MAAGEAGEPEPPGPSRLFAGVTFWVNPSLGLAGYTALAQLLVAHGAEPVTPLPATPLELVRARAFDVDPARVTHVVTPDLDFPSQPSLCALPQPPALVTPAWVHAAVANGFLHRPEYYSPDPANFFSGVVVTTTGGITARDRDLLFAAVEAKGGQFRHNLTKDTTHLVTLMPSGKKYEVALSRPEFGIKVVLPQYFDDCVKLKRRLSENLYQWPEPKILDADGIAGLEIREEADDTDLMPSTRFLADLTFCIPPSLPRIWTDKLTKAGAKVVHNYAPDVDCVVSLDRAGPTWAKAERAGQMVGSTTWLSDLFVAESLLPPKARTLHYPPPSTTETSTFIISITNYTGRAREDIRKMITAIGARYTPELTYRNTHLICAVPKGPKYNKATEWNVAVVNHLWLEETYAKWKVQSVTKAEYVNFPPNLVEIVGDTPVTEDAIRKFLDAQDKGSSGVGLGGGAGSMVGTTVSQTMEHRLSARGRGENRNSQPQARNVLPVDGAEDVPVVHVSLEASGVHASGAVEDSQIAGLRKHPRIVREVLEGERRMSQFSDQVLVASGRPSIVPAELNSPAERSQAGPMGSPGSPLPLVASKGVKRRASSDLESDRDKRRSRESPEPNENRLKDHASPQSTSTRRSPGRTFILAFTGSKPSEKQIKGIKSLGGSIADKVSACTHLIANKVTRTEKMLLAVSMGIPILTMGWIDASLEAGHFIAPESYALQDESSEKQHGYRLAQSLERSRSKKLLAGWHVYVTPNSKPEAETTRTLVEASGGKFTILTQRKTRDLPPNAIVLSCDEDSAFFPEFVERGITAHTTEFLLTGVLRQELPGSEFVLDLSQSSKKKR